MPRGWDHTQVVRRALCVGWKKEDKNNKKAETASQEIFSSSPFLLA